MTFGTNKNLSVAIKSKVVEAHLHNNDERVTLVYLGVGAFTFELGNAKPLNKFALWEGTYKSKKFSCNVIFTGDGKKIEGSGKDEDGKNLKIKGKLHDYENKQTNLKCS